MLLIFFISLLIIGALMNFKIFYFLSLIITFLHLIIYQVRNLNVGNTNQCLQKFKSNNFLGLVVFFNIIIGKII